MSKDQEAVTKLDEKAVQKLKVDIGDAVRAALTLKVKNDESYQQAGEALVLLKRINKEVVEKVEPAKKGAYAAYKFISDLLNTLLGPLNRAEAYLKPQMVAYQQKLKAEAEDRRRKAEEAERKRMEAEREAHAKELEDIGEKQAAKATRATPLATPKVRVPVASAPAGISTREVWSADVFSLEELVKGIASGKADLQCVLPNVSHLNSVARALKQNMAVPGVRAKKETITAARVG